jgi:hypothetical protein
MARNQVTISRIYTLAQGLQYPFPSSIRVTRKMLQLNPPSLLRWFPRAHARFSIDALCRGGGLSGSLEGVGTDALAPLVRSRRYRYSARGVVGRWTRSREVLHAHSRAGRINRVNGGRVRDSMLALAGGVGEKTVGVGEGDALQLEVVLLHRMEGHLLVEHRN